jgi:hypothetical protein
MSVGNACAGTQAVAGWGGTRKVGERENTKAGVRVASENADTREGEKERAGDSVVIPARSVGGWSASLFDVA